MRWFLVLTVALGLAFAALPGCAPVREADQPVIDRARALQVLEGGELAFNLVLNYAELRGADVTAVRSTGSEAFDLAQGLVKLNLRDVSKEGVRATLAQLKVCFDDALALAESVGVGGDRIAAIRSSADEVYLVLESLILALPGPAGSGV